MVSIDSWVIVWVCGACACVHACMCDCMCACVCVYVLFTHFKKLIIDFQNVMAKAHGLFISSDYVDSSHLVLKRLFIEHFCSEIH